jgi:hypothetical protein
MEPEFGVGSARDRSSRRGRLDVAWRHGLEDRPGIATVHGCFGARRGAGDPAPAWARSAIMFCAPDSAGAGCDYTLAEVSG